eukprot:2619170-Pyramimonas_sp.AAC.1
MSSFPGAEIRGSARKSPAGSTTSHYNGDSSSLQAAWATSRTSLPKDATLEKARTGRALPPCSTMLHQST